METFDGTEAATVRTSYFSADYFEARARFRSLAIAAGARVESIGIESTMPTPAPLSIDVAWFGPIRPKQALLHSSGLHGVEGFAGSAIQLHALGHPLPHLPPEMALVFVHCINPWGMFAIRRGNENNVDLNRNCFLLGEPERVTPLAYHKLVSFLNPATPPKFDFFLLRGSMHLVRHRSRGIRQAIASGQYAYPRGLFFGGESLQQETAKYLEWVADRFAHTEHLTAIDVHTGLGAFGAEILLLDVSDDDRDLGSLRAIFGHRLQLASRHGSIGYIPTGRLGPAVMNALPMAQVRFAVEEFGAYSPSFVLHALREENRWHHYGNGNLDHRSKVRLKEMFCPRSARWRRTIVRIGHERWRNSILRTHS